MNKDDREELTRAYTMIDEGKAIVEAIAEQEQSKFDNLTEGLQATERGQRMEEVASELNEVVGALEDALSIIDRAQG